MSRRIDRSTKLYVNTLHEPKTEANKPASHISAKSVYQWFLLDSFRVSSTTRQPSRLTNIVCVQICFTRLRGYPLLFLVYNSVRGVLCDILCVPFRIAFMPAATAGKRHLHSSFIKQRKMTNQEAKKHANIH